jgi:hypothetical protein
MRFPYLPVATLHPVYPLGGAFLRHYPIVPAQISGPLAVRLKDCLVDSGADDTIFPLSVAEKVGVDLTGAAVGEARRVGGGSVPYRYAPVILRLSDGQETYQWKAIVGFLDAPMRWSLLGQTGFLQFFDVTLRGAHRDTVLLPNSSFTGQHTVP